MGGIVGGIGSIFSGGTSSLLGGAASLAGGILGASDASSTAAVANPFGEYEPGFASSLASQAGSGTYGNPNYGGAQALTGAAASGMSLGTALNGQGYAQQINNLVANPSSIYSTPQYQAAFSQGQSAVNATLAAQGLNASGNQLAALQNYGQSFGQQAYATDLSQLSGLYSQSLAGQQQGYSEMQNATSTNLSAQQQAFNQMSALSGLSSGSPTAAANALTQGYSAAGTSIGSGISLLSSGLGSLAPASSSTTGNNAYNFNSGIPASAAGSNISFSGY